MSHITIHVTNTMTLPYEAIMQTQSLFISAGHSHTDPGAVGNGHTEADIVLPFRDAVADELDAKGIHYGSDGRRGVNLPLRQAIEMASHHDVAVEFHCNAAANAAALVTYPFGYVKLY